MTLLTNPADDWVLVGREDELDLLRQARRGDVPAVVVGGGQGVGKSRLAAEALDGARADRWSTEWVDGTAATESVPFGAVAHLAPRGTSSPGDALGLLLATTEHLKARAARRPLMLVVDNAHHLDEASLAVVRRLVGLPSLFLLLTVRSDEPVPTPLVGLWKDGHAHRLEVEPLNRDETYRLAAQALGPDDAPGAARWLWDHSKGNPLYLRELVMAGHFQDEAESAAAGPRLTELVRSRLGQLDEHQRSALEVVVVGGPLPAEVLGALVPPDSVASLVERGLLVERDRQLDLTLAHPVYGVVLGSAMTRGRVRGLRGQLLDLLEAWESESPRSAVRIATLRLDHGVDPDAQQLVVASRYAQSAFPQALAEQLPADIARGVDEITATVALAEPAERPSRHDLAVAERLARAAWDADRSLAAGLSLTMILVARGNGPKAAALTSELDAHARTGPEQVQVALARAALQFWVLGQADDALATLRSAEAIADDVVSRGRLLRLRAGIALNVGRVHQAADLATGLIEEGDQSEPLAAMAAATAAAALALGGRPTEAITMVDRFLPVALGHPDEIPEVVGQLLLARLFADRELGHSDEAEALAYACYQPAAEQGSPGGMAVFTASLGQIALDRGQPAVAARRLREADVLLSDYDTFGYRPWVLACLAMAHAQSGDADSAREAYELARSVTTQPRYFDADLALAEAWCLAAEGRLPDAVTAASSAAELARDPGLKPFEMSAQHAVVRFGQPSQVVERLGELAIASGSPRAELLARHAVDAADDDGIALDQISEAFDKIGARLLAAEAAAQASSAHDRAGRPADARRSQVRSRSLVERCRGAQTPALLQAVRAPELSVREREVAALAARGMTSNAIAERLFVSPRTIESHLYHIFAKLGISDRSELADLLG